MLAISELVCSKFQTHGSQILLGTGWVGRQILNYPPRRGPRLPGSAGPQVVITYSHLALQAGPWEDHEITADVSGLWANVRHKREPRNKDRQLVWWKIVIVTSYSVLMYTALSWALNYANPRNPHLPLYNRHYCAGQASEQEWRDWAAFPRSHAGKNNALALNPDSSTPEAPCLTSILLSKWGNEIRVLFLQGPHLKPWLQSGLLGAFGLCFAVVLDRLYSPLDRTCPRGNYSEILYSSRLHICLHVWNCLHPCGYNKPFSMVTHNDDTITLHSM